ncbi:MAG: prepilin-type N-terminal cleavage/methylation domain-containing protein [Phycisphaerales bacterium]
MPSVSRTIRHAFTLVEVLIVVVILGVLASVVIAMVGDASGDAAKGAFIADIKMFAEAAEVYRVKTGEYLEDSSSGVCPAGFEPYVDEDGWERPTPVGGVWDAELNSYGVTSALGVHFFGGGVVRDDAFMVGIDEIYDDGDLATGTFQKIDNDRYYHILMR